MANPHSIQDVFQQHLDSEELPEPIRKIAKLIASGELSRGSFDELMASEGLSAPSHLKESLLDLILVFARKCIQDHELSEKEMSELWTLTTIFRIEEGDFYQLRPAVVQEILTAQATRILEDRYVTKQEDILQRNLQRVFGLSYDQYVTFLRPLVKQRIKQLERMRLTTQNQDNLKSIESSIRNLRRIFLVSL